jgi:fused signal recognition particle receptor
VDVTTLWFITGGVILAAFVIVGLIAVNRRTALRGRRRPEIEPTPTPPGSGRRGKDADDDGSVAIAERPRAKGAGEVEAPPEVVEPEAPLVETPEAPERRLARLRRRLAGSNNALSRGLLLLISRDRIDEDTWDDFEETLISSDLGVGPTTELVETLRTRFRVDGMPARQGQSCGPNW